MEDKVKKQLPLVIDEAIFQVEFSHKLDAEYRLVTTYDWVSSLLLTLNDNLKFSLPCRYTVEKCLFSPFIVEYA
jgi:hypothetical protein